MRKAIWVSASVGSLLVMAGGGLGVWHYMSHTTQDDVASAVGKPVVLSEGADNQSGNVALDASQASSGATAAKPATSDNNLKVKGNMDQTTSNQVSSPAAAASDNQTEDFSQYEKYKTNETALFADVVVGTGVEAVAGKKLTVNYRGWLTNGQIFDESYARNQPFAFVLGQHQVIAGWEQGMVGMKVGGKRRLIVPPGVGYGAQSTGPIPANSLLVFDVELLSVD